MLFSAKTTAAILVPAELINDIKTNNLSEEETASLGELGMLTSDFDEESLSMTGYIEELNKIDQSHRYIVVMSLDCNLGCTYCFEGKRKGKHILSSETADQFVDFLKKDLGSSKKDIKITFYGGEPLLSVDRIASIAERIHSFAHSQELRYGCSLVTNGTLLTSSVVERLKPLGLKSAKVTLDGPRDIHDKFRPFLSGVGSYDVIMRNIAEVCDLISIQIGGNYTRDNYPRFPELLDDLERKGLTPGRIALIKFDPVVNESSEYGPPDFHDGCQTVNEPWISEAGIFLREEILSRGYRTQKIVPSPCLLEMTGSLVVNYDGSLYKCPGLIGREQCRVGDLATGVRDYRSSHHLDAWKNRKCLDCGYLPLCFGGCKYLNLIRNDDLRGVNCQKEYLDRTLRDLVMQDIRYQL